MAATSDSCEANLVEPSGPSRDSQGQKPKEEGRADRSFRSADPALRCRFRPPLDACAPAPQPRGPKTQKEVTAVGGLSAVSLLVSLQHLEIVHMVAWDRSASAPGKAIYMNPAFH